MIAHPRADTEVCPYTQALSDSRSLRPPGDVRSGESEIIYKSKAYPLSPGDSIIVETGSGGGYGPPSERARDLVERDVRRGFISAEAAAEDYGAAITSPPCGIPI